jgi:hypothetical protein
MRITDWDPDSVVGSASYSITQSSGLTSGRRALKMGEAQVAVAGPFAEAHVADDRQLSPVDEA